MDSSCLIRLKQLVGVEHQWNLFLTMMERVESGHLCFPGQVAAEVMYQRWPDAPGVWLGGARSRVRHPNPSDATVARVLSVAPDLIDAESAGKDIADPYVVAMALDLQESYTSSRVFVASDDIVDRLPLKLSMKTACRRVSVEFVEPEVYVDWCADPSQADVDTGG